MTKQNSFEYLLVLIQNSIKFRNKFSGEIGFQTNVFYFVKLDYNICSLAQATPFGHRAFSQV